MQEQTFLGRLVIIGIDQKYGICAYCLGMAGKPDCLRGSIRTGSCHYRDPSLRIFHGQGDGTVMFVMAQGGTFACGTAGNEPVDAAGYLCFNNLAKGLFIEVILLGKRSDHCGIHPTKEFFCHYAFSTFINTSSSISERVKKPFLPSAIHFAALTAPTANPWRDLARWVNSIVSSGLSK